MRRNGADGGEVEVDLGKVRWRVENPHMKFITFLYMSINVYYNSPGPRAAQPGNSFIQIHIFIVCYISFLFLFFHRFILRFFSFVSRCAGAGRRREGNCMRRNIIFLIKRKTTNNNSSKQLFKIRRNKTARTRSETRSGMLTPMSADAPLIVQCVRQICL